MVNSTFTGKPAQMPRGYFGWNLLDGPTGSDIFRDLLRNFSKQETVDDKYCHGMLLGILSTLIACGMSFEEACQMTWQHLPEDVDPNRIQEDLQERFGVK